MGKIDCRHLYVREWERERKTKRPVRPDDDDCTVKKNAITFTRQIVKIELNRLYLDSSFFFTSVLIQRHKIDDLLRFVVFGGKFHAELFPVPRAMVYRIMANRVTCRYSV